MLALGKNTFVYTRLSLLKNAWSSLLARGTYAPTCRCSTGHDSPVFVFHMISHFSDYSILFDTACMLRIYEWFTAFMASKAFFVFRKVI